MSGEAKKRLKMTEVGDELLAGNFLIVEPETPVNTSAQHKNPFCRVLPKIQLSRSSSYEESMGAAVAPLPLQSAEASAPLGRFETDFVFESVLGEGESGRVVRAVNKLDGVHYAIKRSRSPQHHQELLREIHALAFLADETGHFHPHAVI